MKRKEEAIHDVPVKLFDKLFLGEDGDIFVDATNSLGKAVIIHTANKVCQEALSDLTIDGGKDDL